MEDKPKRGRPKGSKNKPKPPVNQVLEETQELSQNENEWRRKKGYLLPVENISFLDERGEFSTLVGYVAGYGDWDFGIEFPFFEKEIPNAYGDGVWKSFTQIPEERVNKAWVSLNSENKPVRLLLVGQRFISGRWGPEKWVCYYFGEWGPDYNWV